MGPVLCKAVPACVLPSIDSLTEASPDSHLLDILTLCVLVWCLLVLHQLIQGHFGQDLQVHEGQEVSLHVLVLRDLGMVVDGKFHVVESACCNRLVVVHDIVAYSVLCNVSPGQPSLQLAFASILLFLCHHFKVDWTSRKV